MLSRHIFSLFMHRQEQFVSAVWLHIATMINKGTKENNLTKIKQNRKTSCRTHLWNSLGKSNAPFFSCCFMDVLFKSAEPWDENWWRHSTHERNIQEGLKCLSLSFLTVACISDPRPRFEIFGPKSYRLYPLSQWSSTLKKTISTKNLKIHFFYYYY